jgi:multimeric flavodoxin WrbA
MISGSRNHEGQTARAADALLEGVVSAGGQVERIFLPECHLERCRQCDAQGWGTCRSAGHCCIPDDMDELIEKIVAADAVVFATPVYYGDLAESMRTFTDRLRRCATHMAPPRIEGKLAVGVCVAGGGGGGAPKCCASLQNVLSGCGFDVVDLVPVRRQNLPFKLSVLRLTGEWLATGPHSA